MFQFHFSRMENIRFVADDEEEDLYSGFNDFPSALFNTKDLDQDEFVQMALRSSYSKRPGLVSYLNLDYTRSRLIVRSLQKLIFLIGQIAQGMSSCLPSSLDPFTPQAQ